LEGERTTDLTDLQYITLLISILALVVAAGTFVLRWEDRRTNFKVEATRDERHDMLVLTVINRGQGEATLSRLFLAVYQGRSRIGERELTRSFFQGDYDLPMRILSGDRAGFPTEIGFLKLQMKHHNYADGWYLLEPIAEDGRGKQHKGDKVWFEI
jgi:hypothetical protein